MARSRREKTLADYVAIAIGPALITTLVGSLVFFLLQLLYTGQHEFRMKWILFCFVPASILVARIAIEQGKEHASIFGGALALAAGLGMMRFVDAVVVAWVLLAVIWWCAWKLTWDCTLIDDDEDASGEGLLQAAGLAKEQGSVAGAPGRQTPGSPTRQRGDETSVAAGGSEPGSLADASGFQIPDSPTRERGGVTNTPTAGSEPGPGPRRAPHAPGLWVVYFSLAALPLFGIGQLFIPATNVERRTYGFQLLAVYVASALGLLLTTSFLGLRRYLRQRKLQMPVAMTGTWIGMGAALAVALMALALLVPRPQGEYTLTALIDKLDNKVREASKFAVLGGDKGQGEGRRIGEQDQKAKPGEFRPENQKPDQKQDQNPDQKEPGPQQQNQPQGEQAGQQPQNQNAQQQGQGAPGGQQGEPGKDAVRGEQKGDGKQGQADGKGQGQQQGQAGQQQGQAGQKQDQAAAKPGEQQRQGAEQGAKVNPNHAPPPPSAQGLTNLMSQLAPLLKWLLYGVLAIVGIYLLIRHWSRFVELLRQLWAELLGLFGRRPQPTRATEEGGQAEPAPPRPFASFENPFFSGAARRMPPAQLVRYTFEALEAWAREQVVARPADQTPLEFAQELGRRVPALSKDVNQTAQLYDNVAYARRVPSAESVEILERLWRRMQV